MKNALVSVNHHQKKRQENMSLFHGILHCFYLTIVMKPEQNPFNSGSLQSKSSDWTW